MSHRWRGNPVRFTVIHTRANIERVIIIKQINLGTFRRLSAIPHITANELIAALKTDKAPLLLDIRGAAIIGDTGPIAGARVADHRDLKAAVGDWPKNEPIVTLCACPEDAGAIQAASYLLNEGYVSVKPLRGGYDAWLVATATHPSSGD